MSDIPYRPSVLPKNFANSPAVYPASLFRLQLDAARLYLFDGELKDIMDAARLPADLLNPTGPEMKITVAQIATFIQELKAITGDQKAVAFGSDSFQKIASLIPKPGGGSQSMRSASGKNKEFLKIREIIYTLNRHSGANVIVKWHGGDESELFEDSAQHCYGYKSEKPCCQTMTGFLEEAIKHLSGVSVELTEHECMATGALACRWHCRLR